MPDFDLAPNEKSNRYHKTNNGDWSNFASLVVPLCLALGFYLYRLLYNTGVVALEPVDLIWNLLVFIVPGRLLNVFDPLPAVGTSEKITHATKSEQMRRMLRMNGSGGIMNAITNVAMMAGSTRRRLSNLPLISGLNSSSNVATTQPAGLGNWDNSCYQNSVLQGLASLDTLSAYLDSPLSRYSETRPSDAKFEDFTLSDAASDSGNPEDDAEFPVELRMTGELKNLMRKLRGEGNSESNGKVIWTPAPLKNMDSWQQQDAQEYFSRLLDEVDKEIYKATSAVKPPSLPCFEDKDTDRLEKLSRPSNGTASSVRNPLEGLLAQRVGCTACRYSEGLTMIPFNNLTLPLGRDWQYSLAQCLDEYTKLEIIDGVECAKCTLLKLQSQLSTIIGRLNAQTSKPVDEKVLITANDRLACVRRALADDDYEDKTLKNCGITDKNKVKATKTKQAVIARPPKSLAVHIQRSMFDEYFNPVKNTATVRFPKLLNLAHWCLGSSSMPGVDSKIGAQELEEWQLDASCSMIAGMPRVRGPIYELKAVVSHSGRHENGHYICFRRHPPVTPLVEPGTDNDDDNPESTPETLKDQWWRLSDDDVLKVNETTVESQGGVFMLFYDCVEEAKDIEDVREYSTVEQDAHNVTAKTSHDIETEATISALNRELEIGNRSSEATMQHVLEELTTTSSSAEQSPSPPLTSQSLMTSSDNTDTRSDISQATSLSSILSEDESSEPIHHKPTQPILIQPFSTNNRHESSRKEDGQQSSSGGMVMV